MKKILYLLFTVLSFSVCGQDMLMQTGAQSSFPNRDVIGPVFSSASVENSTPNLITVHFSDAHNLDTQTPGNLQWTISGVASEPIVTAQVIDGTAKTIELSLSANLLDTDVPLLSYVNPGDGTGIKDAVGNFMATFSNQSVTNNTGTLPVFSGNANLQWLFTSTGFSGTSTVEDRSVNNNDGELVESHCLTSDGTLVFTFSSLAGITITSDEGTSTPTIVGNTITTTSGTIYHIVLSNGSVIPCAEGSGNTAFDAVNSLNATLSGTVDWSGTQDTYHYNILNGFSHLGRMNAINQYVTLTSNITFSTTKFSIKIIYAPDNIATTQDILGTTTTANRLEIATTAGAMGGLLRFGSGTSYTLTCASNAATIGWANNTFSTIILSRDALGSCTLTINGFTMLIDGAASVVDANSTIFSQLMRTSTANSNLGILKEVEIIDAATSSLIGTKYNADNSFRGTLQGGFALKKYPKPQGGDVSNRNPAGNWHNGAETKVKPNPAGNATLQTATGWDNTTELSYADLSSVVDPSFCNVTNPVRKRNLTSWTTALPYEQEKIANAFVGKNTISVPYASGFSGSNRFNYVAGSSYNANATGFTVKVVFDGTGTIITTSQIIFGKTASIGGNGWAVEWVADAAGSGLSLRVRNGANAVVHSRYVTATEQETSLSIYHFVIRDGFMYSYRNGKKENTVISLVGITNGTDDLVLGGFSGGNGFAYGVVAAAMYENKGMTDNEVEASYQATKNNVYVQEDGITLLYASESGNADWPNRVTGSGGTPTLTKTGTITITSMTEAFNIRWRPEDWPSDENVNVTTLPTADIGFVGDSRIVGGFSEDGLGFRNDFRADADLDADISGVTMTGSQGSAPLQHYGLNGKSTGTLMSEAPGILSVNTTYDWDAIVLMLGTNAMTSAVLFNGEVTDEETLAFSFKRDLGIDTPIIWLSETEHDDAIRRARSDDLMYYRMLLIARLKEQGYKIWHVQLDRTVKHMDGDFIDVVHENDQGNAKIEAVLFPIVKRALGYTP